MFSLKQVIFLIFCLLGLLSIIFLQKENSVNFLPNELRQVQIFTHDKKITLDTFVAKTIAEKNRGLSVFDSLGDDQAMLFVFEDKKQHGFWMKDMKFPIDIIWLDEHKRVVFIKENAHPKDFPETYKPTQLAQYVVEVNAGYVKKHNIHLENQFIW